MNQKIITLIVFWTLLTTTQVFAQPFRLVKDFTPGIKGTFEYGSSTGIKASFDNRILFARDTASFTQLWITDGLEFNTRKVFSMPRAHKFTYFESEPVNEVAFCIDTKDSFLLMVMNKTNLEVQKIYTSRYRIEPAFYNGSLYFGNEPVLYQWNFQDKKLSIVQTFGSRTIKSLKRFGNKLAFMAEHNKEYHLFMSDGTSAGSQPIYLLTTGSDFSTDHYMTDAGEKLYFFYGASSAAWSLYVTDGTSAGTKKLQAFKKIEFDRLNDFRGIIAYKGKLLFYGAPPSHPTDGEGFLYVSDGTEAGTLQLYNGNGRTPNPNNMVLFNDRVYFRAFTSKFDSEVMSTDGTVAGTTIAVVTGLLTGNEAYFGGFNLVTHQDTLFFSARNTNRGYELWKTSGTSATTSCVEFIPGKSGVEIFAARSTSNLLFFIGEHFTEGNELFTYDGKKLTGIKGLQKQLPLEVYPIPVQDQLALKLPDGTDLHGAKLNLYNSSGNTVLRTTWTGAPLDVSRLAPGWYVMQVIHAQGTYQVKVLKG